MEYPRAYKRNIIEYPLKYDIIFHLGLPQEYAYSYSPRRPPTLTPRGPVHQEDFDKSKAVKMARNT